MPSSAKEKELSSFMIKFTYDTQKIEGSKLTLKDTANLLERGISPKERPIRDIKEAEAHKKVFYEMLKYDKDLSMQIVLYWHKKLFEESDKEIAGKIREHGVQISMSKFMPPSPVELQTLLREFFDWYNQNKNKIVPVELAALVHLKFVSIHPFSDGNGRISRLMMNFVLHKCGFPMLDIPYAKRTGYYNALERSQIKNEEHIFVQWFFKKFIESNKRFC
jgi:Fic family protein